MEPKPAEQQGTLTARLRIFHPDYRGLMLTLLIIGAITAGLTFCGIELIMMISQAVSTAGGSGELLEGQQLHWLIRYLADPNVLGPGVKVIITILVVYAVIVLLASGARILAIRLQSLLDIRSRNDIEKTMLANLLRKDDKFFLTHSAAEIANRLNVDTRDMIERRTTVIELFSTIMSSAAILLAFALKDWTYAVVALVFSSIGVAVMQMMLGEMEYLKREQLESDDNIKATFEDYLGATPEIQVGNLYDKVGRRVVDVQERRQRAFMRSMTLNAQLGAVYSINQLVALLAILGAITYQLFVGGDANAVGIVAGVVYAVPQLYGGISELARIRMELKLAQVNERRLSQYDAEFRKPSTLQLQGSAPPPISVSNVKYAFAPGDQLRGGPDGISLEIAPNTMNVIVGPAGSGKSTLAQLMMGRMPAASGRISAGDIALSGPEASAAQGIFSYMPQSLTLIDGSIEENIRFGIPPDSPMAQGRLDEAALGWIDRTMVSGLARERALEMAPVDHDLAPYSANIAELRAALRQRIETEARIPVMPFDPSAVVPRLTVLENLTTSAADMERLFRFARSRENEAALQRLAEMPGAKPVIEFARNVFAQTSQMLQRCPAYDAYSGLAPFPISPMVWDFRSRLIREGGPLDRPDPRTQRDLLFAGLTASPPEGDGTATEMLIQYLNSAGQSPFTEALARHFEQFLTPLSTDSLNANLKWRDNLLFGVARITNAKAAAEVNRIVLGEVEGKPVDEPMVRSGLRYHVGRQGKRLSGGQRQLLCLCRAFVQGNPVLIVDEPTAALDPNSRGAINALLRDAARQRTVIAITHDVELAKLADNVIMMKEGRLWATGTFDALVENSPEFRQMINMREEARL